MVPSCLIIMVMVLLLVAINAIAKNTFFSIWKRGKNAEIQLKIVSRAVEDLRMTSCGTIVFGRIGYASGHL